MEGTLPRAPAPEGSREGLRRKDGRDRRGAAPDAPRPPSPPRARQGVPA